MVTWREVEGGLGGGLMRARVTNFIRANHDDEGD